MGTQKIFLTKIQHIAKEEPLLFSVAGRSVCLLRQGLSFYAFENRCSHDNGPLAEAVCVEGNLIECPRHGARFDLSTGKAVRMPAVFPIEVYPIEIHNDEIWIIIPEENRET